MQFGWTADKETSFQVLNAAFDAGLQFLDTANVYSKWVAGNFGGEAETILGEWMRQHDVPRSQLVLATKVRGGMGAGPNNEGLSRVHILKQCEDSLRRLQTDYIDLYQTHWVDTQTPIDETLRALDDLVHQGKVRYIGCSNYSAWRLMEALWVSDRGHLARFDSLQPHYSLVHRDEYERELEQVCVTYGLGVLPYSPLEAGFLTGKYRRGGPEVDSPRARHAARYFNDRNWDLLDLLEQIGTEIANHRPAQPRAT